MEKQPFVSVIINTVDRPADLKRCLEAVLKQSFRNFEIIVVNNGKGEETKKLLKQFNVKCSALGGSNVKLRVVEDLTKRLSYLFNLGWKNADPKAEIFAYCADDTEPDPDWLKNIVSYLKNHPQVGAISGPTLSTTKPPGEMFALYNMMEKNIFTRAIFKIYEYFVLEGKTFEPGHWCQSGAFTMGAGIPLPSIKKPIEIDLLTSGNMGVRRAIMEKIGGFDENFYFNHADGDLFIRIKKLGAKLIFHPQVKVLHHMRFGPTRYPQIMGRDTAFYYLKDVRPKSLRGWIGALINIFVFNVYWIFKAIQIRDLKQLRGISGFMRGIYDFFATKSAERNLILKKFAVFLGFLILFAQAYRRVWFGGMLAYGDCLPFPEKAKDAFSVFFSAWQPKTPGIEMPQFPVIAQLTLFEGILLSLFKNPILIQRVFHWAPLPLAFLTMYKALGRFVNSRLAKFIAAFFYSANLVAIGEVLGGYEGSLYVQVFLPLMLVSLYDLYLEKAIKFNLLKFSLLLTLSYLFSDHVLIVLIPFLAIFWAALFLKKKSLGLFRAAGFATAISSLPFFLTFLLGLPFIWPYLKVAFPYLWGEKIPKDTLDFFLQNVRDTYHHWTLGDTLRLGGGSYIRLFSGNVFWARCGFSLPLLAFLAPFFRKNRRGERKKILSICLSLATLDIIFIYLTHRYLTLGIFSRFPFLLRLRNPARPSLFLALVFAPLIALTLEAFLEKLWRLWLAKNRLFFFSFLIVFLGVLGGFFYYEKPFFLGDLTMEKNRGETYRIADFYYEISNLISKRREKEGLFRTWWLPWTHEETEVKLHWLDPYTFSLPITYGAYIQPPFFKLVGESYDLLAEEKTLEVGKITAPGGVKYIVLNLSSKEKGRARAEHTYHTHWALGSPFDWQRILKDQKDLKLVVQKPYFEIYENTSFSKEILDPELSGLYPLDLSQRQKVKNITMLISLLAWAGVLGGLVYKSSESKARYANLRELGRR